MLVETMWPAFCRICGRPGSYICPNCRKNRIEKVYEHYCHVCGVVARKQLVHSECLQYTYLDGVYVGYDYSGAVEDMLKEIKYKGYSTLVDALTQPLKEELISWASKTGSDLVTFVPTVRKRKWSRGFNQSELVAKLVGAAVNMKVVGCLRRKSYNHSQVGSGAEERKANVSGSFELAPGINLERRRVLLVDDVMTTGATLEVCAKVLKQTGADRVFGLVIARRRPASTEDML